MNIASEIYDLLGSYPEDADRKALSLLSFVKNQNEIDEINWARAYALVELKNYSAALSIWQEIFDRTQDHKALHQVGFVARSSGDLSSAATIFNQEYNLILSANTQALAVNLYEQSFCNLLLGNLEKAYGYFRQYENLNIPSIDLIERGCFFRLKGDILKTTNKNMAKSAYEESLSFFMQANDEFSCSEIKERLKSLL